MFFQASGRFCFSLYRRLTLVKQGERMEERKSVDSAPQSQDRSCKVKKAGSLTV